MSHISVMDTLEFHPDRPDSPITDMSDVLDVMRRSMPPQALDLESDSPEENGRSATAVPQAPATWLDAMPHDDGAVDAPTPERSAAVNSDDNGLYRMFRNLAH